MGQTADLGEVAGHDDFAQDQLGRAVQHQRVEDVVLPIRLEELAAVAVGQTGDQLLGVAGGVVAGELKVRRSGGDDGAGIRLIGIGDALGGGDVGGSAHVDEPAPGCGLGSLGRQDLVVCLRFLDGPAVDHRSLGGRKLHDRVGLADGDFDGRLLDLLFLPQNCFGVVGVIHLVVQGSVEVDQNLSGTGRDVDLHGDLILRGLDDVLVHRGLALEGAALPAVGRHVFLQIPATVFREVVPDVQIEGLRHACPIVQAVEAAAGVLGTEVEIVVVGRDQLLRLLGTQGFAVGGGVGVLGPQLLVAVQGRGLDLPGKIAAGPLLGALHGNADGLHGVVEEQGRDVEAHAKAPLEVGDVEALVLVRVLQVAAHGHGNSDAGLDKELKLQQLHADADTGLQLDAGGDAQTVEDHLAARARHGAEPIRHHLAAQGGQPDIHGLVVGLQQDLLFRAVAGERPRVDGQVVETWVVKDFHVDRAQQVDVEAADGILAAHIQGEDDGASLAQTFQASLAEVRDLAAQLGIADHGQGDRDLHLDAQLHVDVGQGEEAEPVLGGELDAQAGGQARRLEEVAVVDGIVLEHDGDLHREGDLHLGGRAVAVFGVLEALVLPGAAHEVLHLLHIAGLAGADKVRQGLHLPVGFLEALLELVIGGIVLGRGGREVVFHAFSVVHPAAVLFAQVFLLDAHGFIGLVAILVRCFRPGDDGAAIRFLGVRLRADGGDGIAVLGGDGKRLAGGVRRVVNGRAVVQGRIAFRAGIVGILVFVDGNADGEAHLVAVDDEGGVVAQLQLQARHFRPQVRAELGIASVVPRCAAVGAARVAAGGHVHHAVAVWGGGNGTHGDRLGLEQAPGFNVLQRCCLLLYAQHEGTAPGHGAQEGVHGVLAGLIIIVTLAVLVVLYGLSGHRHGVAGDVVGIDDRRGLNEGDQKIAHEVWRPGVGLRGVRPCDFSVLVLDRLGNGLVLHAARVAAQGNIHVAHGGGLRAVHGMAVRVRAAQIAVALLLRGQGRGARRVRDGAGQGRQNLRPVAAACVGRDVVGLGAQGVEDLQIILIDDGLPIRVRADRGLEGGFGIVALQTGRDQLVDGLPVRVLGQEEGAVRIAALDDAVSVLVVVELHVVDAHPHIGDLIQIVLAVVFKPQHGMGHILRCDGDRRVAGIGSAVVEDDVLRVLMEVDGLDILVACFALIDRRRVAFLPEVRAVEGVGLLG